MSGAAKLVLTFKLKKKKREPNYEVYGNQKEVSLVEWGQTYQNRQRDVLTQTFIYHINEKKIGIKYLNQELEKLLHIIIFTIYQIKYLKIKL